LPCSTGETDEVQIRHHSTFPPRQECRLWPRAGARCLLPRVTEANLIGKDDGSVTIGYNGKERHQEKRQFSSELKADGLMADCALWNTHGLIGGSGASNAIALFCRQTWRAHFQNKRLHRVAA